MTTLRDELKQAEDDATKMRAVLARFPDADLDHKSRYTAPGVVEQADGVEWCRDLGAAGSFCFYAAVPSDAGEVRVYSEPVDPDAMGDVITSGGSLTLAPIGEIVLVARASLKKSAEAEQRCSACGAGLGVTADELFRLDTRVCQNCSHVAKNRNGLGTAA